ncbi:MAG: division/cell wall cluster transcriptional repressor MraZ [Desulfobacteria bacterium]|jgi:MraZ protein
MFRGRYEHTIDSKGRVSLPVKFREVLNERYDDRLVITNFDGCLVAYPFDEWRLLEEKVSSMSIVKKDVKSFQRFFISGATECTIDKQGRILLPPTLREYAKLEKDIVFAGMTKKIEIWSKEKWEQEIAKAKENFDEISDALGELGL